MTQNQRDGVHVYEDLGARERGLLVAFTDRRGGQSKPPFDSLNLAATVGDDVAVVDGNRRRVAAALGFAPDVLALARQVHGADLIAVPGGCSGVVGVADVLATSATGQALAILTADCTPVVVAGERRVALAHAGWRGLVAGAIETALEWVGDVDAAWVGPCIRACCYEVGPEVIDAFEQRGLPVADERHVDPRDASLHVLKSTGVAEVAAPDVCTYCDRNFYSYRRDGITGRQGAFVTLLA